MLVIVSPMSIMDLRCIRYNSLVVLAVHSWSHWPLLLNLHAISFISQHLADHRHLVILLASVNVSFESCIGGMHYLPFLSNVFSSFTCHLIFLPVKSSCCILLFKVLIDLNNLFLQNS
jgi:hypothetical protein